MAKSQVPPYRKCGAMSNHYWLLEQHPEFATAQIKLEHAVNARRRAMVIGPTKPYVIKVVVQVLYATPAQKITITQVKSQIAALNRDYRSKNKDKTKVPKVWMGLVSDTMVQFELATKDPKGKATKGVTWTAVKDELWGQNDSMKDPKRGGVAPWATDKYLNLWVCGLKDQLLGYAQFPGGPKASDGVVITPIAFGTMGSATAPYNFGRTATHEIGHYFNLRHIWGDTPDCSGGDMVDDTPNAQDSNFGKPKFPHVTCGNGPNGDMFMNYMDYTDDDSMFMFTAGQVARMHATLEGPRRTLWQA